MYDSMALSRRHQSYAFVAVAAVLLLAVNYLSHPLAIAESREEQPQQPQQIGGTTSWQRADDDDDAARTTVLRAPTAAAAKPVPVSIAAATAMLAERTLQCPTYAGPMYFPYSAQKPVARRPVKVLALPTALEEQPSLKAGVAALSLLPFELSAVRLAPDTRFGDAQKVNANFLRLLDPDRLLYFFRRLANLPQPRTDIVPYGGWESQGSGLRGEFAGHYLHAASAVAAASDDALLRTRCEMIVSVLAACQAASADGYLSAFPQSEFATVENFQSRAPWVPYYVIHKLLSGLLATHELLGSHQALEVALKLAVHVKGRVHRLLAKGIDTWQYARASPAHCCCVRARHLAHPHEPACHAHPTRHIFGACVAVSRSPVAVTSSIRKLAA